MYRRIAPPVRRPQSDHHLAICKYCTFTMIVPCVDMYARFDPLTNMYECEWSGDTWMTVEDAMNRHFLQAHVEVPSHEDVHAGWTYRRVRRPGSSAIATAECDYCKMYQFTVRAHDETDPQFACALGASNATDLHKLKHFHRMACMPYMRSDIMKEFEGSELILGRFMDPPEFHDPDIFE